MLGKHALRLWFAFAFTGGQSISLGSHDEVDEPQYNRLQTALTGNEHDFEPMAAAGPWESEKMNRTDSQKWTFTCSSGTKEKCNQLENPPRNFYWQSTAATSHEIQIDLGVKDTFISAISMTPRVDSDKAVEPIGIHRVSFSTDGKNWDPPVAFGTWWNDETDKFAVFEPQKAQHIQIQAFFEDNASKSISIAGLSVWKKTSFSPPDPNQSSKLGQWGATIDFPIVPVGVWIDPTYGKLIAFSSKSHDGNDRGQTDNTTWTSTWTPGTESVSEKSVSKTEHDMFCPGMAFDVNGRMIITGGESADKTSIYTAKDKWSRGPAMNIPRGYQGSTTCADGRIFVIGGSWSPAQPKGNKSGESWDPDAKEWQKLEKCDGNEIRTDDWDVDFRQDNHVWLFGWKKNTVFQAGPSKMMHWITTKAPGGITKAGLRKTDSDAMAGVAAMYDAVAGKILTAGGAPQYKYSKDDYGQSGPHSGSKPATNNAFLIELKDDQKVTVTTLKSMAYKRIFHHAVILPNGNTFVVGGQEIGDPWLDKTAQLEPEMFSPANDGGSWAKMAKNTIPRTYHSFGLLLQDATVVVGGGGLCGGHKLCHSNHFDAQIYYPPYLFKDSGERAKQPKILELNKDSVKPGAEIIITTDVAVDLVASLIRYGAATHSLNNDQRRIVLTLTKLDGLKYKFTIPPDGGVALPGYWMLFVLDKGVPSISKNVQILVGK